MSLKDLVTRPRASQRLRTQQEFWRLKQEIVDTGVPAFECDASVRALAIGPDSDFSRVLCTYFDGLSDDPIEATFGVAAPLVGRIDATLTGKHSISGTDGRILVWTDQRAFGEGIPSPSSANWLVVRPIIDVLGFFTEPRNLPTMRADRLIRTPFPLEAAWDGSTPGSNRIRLPFYGRRFASILFSPDGMSGLSADPTVDVIGLNFLPGSISPETTILSGESIARTSETRLSVKSSTEGFFDYLELRIETDASADVFDGTGTEQLYVTIRTSDEEQ